MSLLFQLTSSITCLPKMRKKDTIVILLLLILVLIFFRKLLNYNKIFLGADLIPYYPMKEFLVTNIKKGIFPLWNPHIFCGSPCISNSTLALFSMFYPLNIIFLFTPLNFAFNIAAVIHIFLAGLFMYILVRSFGLDEFSSLFSGIIFMFSGAFIALVPAGGIDMITGITWIPLIFFLIDKALKENKHPYIYSVLAGAIVGLQGLGGHIQISAMTIYLLFFYLIYMATVNTFKKELNLKYINRSIIIFGIALLASMGLYAIEIFPMIEVFLTNSTRSFNMDYKGVSHCSIPIKELLLFLSPNLFDNPVTGYYLGKGYHFEELCRYIGISPLILVSITALFVKKNEYIKFYLGLLIVSILIALGSYGPIHKLCYYLLPGFRAFRWPARWLFFSVFSISILSGFGLFFLIDKVNHRRNLRFLIRGLLSFNVLIILMLCLDGFTEMGIASRLTKWITNPFFDNEVDFQYRYSIVKESLFNFTLLLTSTTICLVAFYKNKVTPLLFKILIFAITIFDLWFFGHRFIIPVNSESYLTSKQWDFFKKDKDFYRIFVEPPINDYGAQANGYYVFIGENPDYELKNYNIFKQRVKKFPQILNAKYYLTTKYIDSQDLELKKTINTTISDVFNFKKYRIYESPVNIYQYKNFLPRAFIVHKAIIAKDEEGIFEKLNDPSFNPREIAILEGEGFFLKMSVESEDIGKDSVEIIHYSPNGIRLKANLKKNGLLILNEIFFPGWQAYVDGQKEHIFKANYIMRSVYLREGSHAVEFVYTPLSFKIGATITLLTTLILLSLGVKYTYTALKTKLMSI